MKSLIDQAKVSTADVKAVMLGTTAFVNAVL